MITVCRTIKCLIADKKPVISQAAFNYLFSVFRHWELECPTYIVYLLLNFWNYAKMAQAVKIPIEEIWGTLELIWCDPGLLR